MRNFNLSKIFKYRENSVKALSLILFVILFILLYNGVIKYDSYTSCTRSITDQTSWLLNISKSMSQLTWSIHQMRQKMTFLSESHSKKETITKVFNSVQLDAYKTSPSSHVAKTSPSNPTDTCYNHADISKQYELSLSLMYKTFPSSDDILQRMMNCLTLRKLSKTFRKKTKQFYDGLIDKVPNIVHYVRFGSQRAFEFRHYLSYLSVHKFIQPDYIFLHGDVLPSGYWWNRTMRDVANLYHIHRRMPFAVNGHVLTHVQHTTDVVRLETLLGMTHAHQFFNVSNIAEL